MKYHKFRIISLTLFFIGFISFPIINDTCYFVKDSANYENRALAKKPVFDINYLDPYPELFEKYYNDHFSMRFRLIKYFNYFNMVVFKQSPYPWFFIAGYNNWHYLSGRELYCYQGIARFNAEHLKFYKQTFEAQKKYLEEHGCKFYVMITPSKAIVYPENMPHHYYRYYKESIGEQLTKYLRDSSKINVISVYETFEKIKTKNQLYYRYDTHWNNKGAFYASTIACSSIGKDFPSVMPLSDLDFIIKEKIRVGGDLVNLLSNPEDYEETDYEFISKRTNKPFRFGRILDNEKRFSNQPKKPDILLVSDSFSNLFFPFIAESFNKSLNIFDESNYNLQTDLVEKEKPAVYLLMIHEPLLLNMIEKK